MRWFSIALLMAACSNCRPQPIPTPLPVPPEVDMSRPKDMTQPGDMNEYGLPNCSFTISVTFTDMCDSMFTRAGLACATCDGGSACFDAIDGIYCASGRRGCFDDDACIQVKDGESGSPGSKKAIKRVKRQHKPKQHRHRRHTRYYDS